MYVFKDETEWYTILGSSQATSQAIPYCAITRLRLDAYCCSLLCAPMESVQQPWHQYFEEPTTFSGKIIEDWGCSVQIEADSLTKTANQNWSMQARNKAKQPPFKPDLVVSIYNNELYGSKPEPPKLKRIMMLEISQYLENYLIPNFGPVSCLTHDFERTCIDFLVTQAMTVALCFRFIAYSPPCGFARMPCPKGLHNAELSVASERGLKCFNVVKAVVHYCCPTRV